MGFVRGVRLFLACLIAAAAAPGTAASPAPRQQHRPSAFTEQALAGRTLYTGIIGPVSPEALHAARQPANGLAMTSVTGTRLPSLNRVSPDPSMPDLSLSAAQLQACRLLLRTPAPATQSRRMTAVAAAANLDLNVRSHRWVAGSLAGLWLTARANPEAAATVDLEVFDNPVHGVGVRIRFSRPGALQGAQSAWYPGEEPVSLSASDAKAKAKAAPVAASSAQPSRAAKRSTVRRRDMNNVLVAILALLQQFLSLSLLPSWEGSGAAIPLSKAGRDLLDALPGVELPTLAITTIEEFMDYMLLNYWQGQPERRLAALDSYADILAQGFLSERFPTRAQLRRLAAQVQRLQSGDVATAQSVLRERLASLQAALSDRRKMAETIKETKAKLAALESQIQQLPPDELPLVMQRSLEQELQAWSHWIREEMPGLQERMLGMHSRIDSERRRLRAVLEQKNPSDDESTSAPPEGRSDQIPVLVVDGAFLEGLRTAGVVWTAAMTDASERLPKGFASVEDFVASLQGQWLAERLWAHEAAHRSLGKRMVDQQVEERRVADIEKAVHQGTVLVYGDARIESLLDTLRQRAPAAYDAIQAARRYRLFRETLTTLLPGEETIERLILQLYATAQRHAQAMVTPLTRLSGGSARLRNVIARAA